MERFEVAEGYITAYGADMIHQIPLAALATWGELLGMDDALDVLDAIVHKDRVGEPPEDPLTGENVWTEVFQIETHLEQVRETEAQKQIDGVRAQADFTAARSEDDFDGQREALRTLRRCGEARKADCPKQWSASKVKEELHRLSGGECPDSETILAKCQKRARELLGTPDPTCTPKAERDGSMTCDAEPHTTESEDRERELSVEERQQCRSELSKCEPHQESCEDGCSAHCPPDCTADHLHECMEWIRRRRLLFCHQLTGYAEDPLADEYEVPTPERGGATLPTHEDIAARYEQGD